MSERGPQPPSGADTPAVELELPPEAFERIMERMLPVYDLQGNLYWPQEMSYAWVRAFAAQRDCSRGQEG